MQTTITYINKNNEFQNAELVINGQEPTIYFIHSVLDSSSKAMIERLNSDYVKATIEYDNYIIIMEFTGQDIYNVITNLMAKNSHRKK